MCEPQANRGGEPNFAAVDMFVNSNVVKSDIQELSYESKSSKISATVSALSRRMSFLYCASNFADIVLHHFWLFRSFL